MFNAYASIYLNSFPNVPTYKEEMDLKNEGKGCSLFNCCRVDLDTL